MVEKRDDRMGRIRLTGCKKICVQLVTVSVMVAVVHFQVWDLLAACKSSFFVNDSNTHFYLNAEYQLNNNPAIDPILNCFLPSISLPVPKSEIGMDKPAKVASLPAAKNLGDIEKAESVSSPIKMRENRFQPIIFKIAKRHQIEPALIKAIIMAESGFNPNAKSHRGAQGLMQLMPKTAEYLGVKDAFNPTHNIEGGTRYFKRLLERFDRNIELALAAYNAGSRNVRKYGGVPPFKATKIYINKVLKYYELFKANATDSLDSASYLAGAF